MKHFLIVTYVLMYSSLRCWDTLLMEATFVAKSPQINPWDISKLFSSGMARSNGRNMEDLMPCYSSVYRYLSLFPVNETQSLVFNRFKVEDQLFTKFSSCTTWWHPCISMKYPQINTNLQTSSGQLFYILNVLVFYMNLTLQHWVGVVWGHTK